MREFWTFFTVGLFLGVSLSFVARGGVENIFVAVVIGILPVMILMESFEEGERK